MPLYDFKCECGNKETDLLLTVSGGYFCDSCGKPMERDYSNQTISMRPDIDPQYDISLGEYITSRKDKREKLAYNNAYCPDLMVGSNPSAGRLVKEEKDILEGTTPVLESTDIAVEGEADYGEVRKQIEKTHGW